MICVLACSPSDHPNYFSPYHVQWGRNGTRYDEIKMLYVAIPKIHAGRKREF